MHRALVPALGLILATALAGCVSDEAGGILVLKNVRADDSCTTTGEEDQFGISHGSLDILFPSDYLFIAQMRSRIGALDGQESQRTILTSGARVDITFPGSTVFDETELAELREQGYTHFRQLFVAPIAPNDGVTDAAFVLIPQALVEKIAAKAPAGALFRIQALATFTIEGDMSGQHVESQEFAYPVTIGTDLVTRNIGACSAIMDGQELNEGYACNVLQDGAVDCCTSGGNIFCPARKI